MGSGIWSASTYTTNTVSSIKSGTTFGYDRMARSTGRYAAHESLDPIKAIASAGPLAGQRVRESRDNDDHPNSTPVIIGFDSTGSMGSVPRTVQSKLGKVFNLLLEKNYLADPQVAIATYGDAYCDRVPLQFSQFESDNKIDTNLDNLFLEGGGGGNGGETASLMLYFAAHHTVTDAWEKRGKRGYMFLIADETMLDLQPSHITKFLGETEAKTNHLTVEQIVSDVTEKWEVVVLLIDNMSARMQGSLAHYTDLFGEDHVLVVENPDTIAETIASAIGALEGTASNDKIVSDLSAAGTDIVVANKVANAVSRLDGKKTTVVHSTNLAHGRRAARL